MQALNRRSDKIQESEDKNVMLNIDWILQKANYKKRYKLKKKQKNDSSEEKAI